MGYDEFNLIKGPANYGWPYCVGPNLPYNDIDSVTGAGTGEPFDCNNLVNRSSARADKNLGPASMPFIWYPYGVGDRLPRDVRGVGRRHRRRPPGDSRARSTGRSRAAGCRCSSTTRGSSPTGRATGSSRSSSTTTATSCESSASLPGRGLAAPIDMELGADGSLYVLEWGGQSIPFGNPTAAKVVRYQYVPKCGTCDPTIPAGGNVTPAPGVDGQRHRRAGCADQRVPHALGHAREGRDADLLEPRRSRAQRGVGGDRRGRAAAVRVAEHRRPVPPWWRAPTASASGKYDFVCTVHPSMKGTLEVR